MLIKKIYSALFFCMLFCVALQAQYRKIDTTMRVGKAGYKVYCNNKNPEKNNLTITPLGFEAGVREVTFEVK